MDPYLDLRALWRKQEQLYEMAGRWAEKAGDQQEALAFQGSRANVLSKLHRWVEAENIYGTILQAFRRLVEADPDAYLSDVAGTLNNLGNLLAGLGQREEARKSFEEALVIRRALARRYPDVYLPDMAMTLNNLGLLLADLGQREEARGHYEEALGIYWPFFEKFPDAFRRNILVVLNGLRQVCLVLGLEERVAWCTGMMEQVAGGESGGTQGDGT